MYIHLFSTESSYSNALLQCLKGNIDMDQHWFVFGFAFIKFKKKTYQYDAEIEKQVIRLKNPLMMVKYFKLLRQSKWIYLHLLPYDPTLLFWRCNLPLVHKTTWIIWGTDIYSYLKRDQNIKTRLYEALRKRVIPEFPEISGYVDQDLDLINSLYHTNAEFIRTMYPYPVNFEHLDAVNAPKEQRKEVHVMIGNSGDNTNNHEEIINYLSRFKDEPICIYCLLSYGGSANYREEITNKGKKVFSDKFIPITAPMNPEEYSRFLASIDIALMNHQRQQALGNITALLYLGRKVYLRKAVTTFHFMSEHNIQVFDIAMLENQSFTDFIRPVEDAQQNKIAIEKISSNAYFLSLWLALFKRH